MILIVENHPGIWKTRISKLVYFTYLCHISNLYLYRGKRTSSDPKYQQDIPVVGVALVVEKVEFNGHELRTPAARETHTLAARL